MKQICKNCKFWISETKECNSNFIGQLYGEPLLDNQLAFDVPCDAGECKIYAGKDFGCIHWQQKN